MCMESEVSLPPFVLLVSVWYSAGAEFDHSFPPVVAGNSDNELQFPSPLSELVPATPGYICLSPAQCVSMIVRYYNT